MIPGGVQLNGGLGLRPATPSDSVFIESLYRTTRDDLRLVDGEEDFIESLIDMQHRAQTVGLGQMFPNAMYFVIERLGERIGRLVIDFGPNEVHIADVAFVPEARGKGYGTILLRGLQQAAAMVRAPLVLSVYRHNLRAKQFYLSQGFQIEESSPIADLLAWYPTAKNMQGF